MVWKTGKFLLGGDRWELFGRACCGLGVSPLRRRGSPRLRHRTTISPRWDPGGSFKRQLALRLHGGVGTRSGILRTGWYARLLLLMPASRPEHVVYNVLFLHSFLRHITIIYLCAVVLSYCMPRSMPLHYMYVYRTALVRDKSNKIYDGDDDGLMSSKKVSLYIYYIKYNVIYRTIRLWCYVYVRIIIIKYTRQCPRRKINSRKTYVLLVCSPSFLSFVCV